VLGVLHQVWGASWCMCCWYTHCVLVICNALSAVYDGATVGALPACGRHGLLCLLVGASTLDHQYGCWTMVVRGVTCKARLGMVVESKRSVANAVTRLVDSTAELPKLYYSCMIQLSLQGKFTHVLFLQHSCTSTAGTLGQRDVWGRGRTAAFHEARQAFTNS